MMMFMIELYIAGKIYKLNKYISRIKAKSYDGIKFISIVICA